MMKKMLVLICMVALGFLLTLTACDKSNSTEQSAELESVKAELEQLKAALGKTESERDNLKVKVAVGQRDREQLQGQVNELTRSRDQLQKQVEKFTFTCDQSRQQLEEIIDTRDKLKKEVAELTGSRDTLQQRYDKLAASHDQLNKQVSMLTELRDEAVTTAQSAQKRMDVLVAMLDSEMQSIPEQHDKITVANQSQEDVQSSMNEMIEYPTDAPAEVSRPVVVPSSDDGRPTCHSFDTTRPKILPGQSSTLSWQVSNASLVEIEPGIGRVSALGSRVIKPSTATTYTLIATNNAGESRITCRIEVGDSTAIQKQSSNRPAIQSEVIEPPVINNQDGERPVCHSFNTTRPRIMPGQTSTLSWQVSNAERVRIEPGIGRVSALGSRAVKPSTTTTYTLIAANKTGQSRLSCRIEISERITTLSSDAIHPRILLEEDTASDDRKVMPGQKPPVSDKNTTLGKFLGYRARKDESGKFIFIPVFENTREE